MILSRDGANGTTDNSGTTVESGLRKRMRRVGSEASILFGLGLPSPLPLFGRPSRQTLPMTELRVMPPISLAIRAHV